MGTISKFVFSLMFEGVVHFFLSPILFVTRGRHAGASSGLLAVAHATPDRTFE